MITLDVAIIKALSDGVWRCHGYLQDHLPDWGYKGVNTTTSFTARVAGINAKARDYTSIDHPHGLFVHVDERHPQGTRNIILSRPDPNNPGGAWQYRLRVPYLLAYKIVTGYNDPRVIAKAIRNNRIPAIPPNCPSMTLDELAEMVRHSRQDSPQASPDAPGTQDRPQSEEMAVLSPQEVPGGLL